MQEIKPFNLLKSLFLLSGINLANLLYISEQNKYQYFNLI